MMGEGVIKYKQVWSRMLIPEFEMFEKLNACRTNLHQLKHIGVNDEGISYGNLSARESVGTNNFIITGTDTGKLAMLTANDYAKIVGFDISKNQIKSQGLVRASSEAMTHAVLYAKLPSINAVVHIHNQKLWETYLNRLPTSSANAEYGTPQIALSIEALICMGELIEKTIIMGGHPDGILCFGESIEECYNTVVKLQEKFV